jgi:peptidoglycan hydrolase-like protein with peptidoglycan-binding domain
VSTHAPSRWRLALSMLLLGAAVGAGALWFNQRDTDETPPNESTEVTTTTLEAEMRDLTSYAEWAATLQSGTSAAISATTRGTITSNADVGDRIELGDVVAAIDGNPVVALYGSVPQFRELDINTDDGADVRQLEENLVALGYDPDGTVTVDEHYTVFTGEMVERWETDLGLEDPDTIIAAGQIAFIAGPSEVATRTAVGSQVTPGQSLATTVTLAKSGYLTLPVGVSAIAQLASPGVELTEGLTIGEVERDGEILPLITVAGVPDNERTDAVEVALVMDAVVMATVLERSESIEAGQPLHLWEAPQGSIELEVDVDEIENFPVGLAVEVELPDGHVVSAIVDSVDDVARTVQSGQDSLTIVDVSIQPTGPVDSDFASGPVTVRVEDVAILNATMIPVRGLVALAEGGHAIEVEGRGLIAVELGAFDDGWVEVTNGSIEPGELLVVPT